MLPASFLLVAPMAFAVAVVLRLDWLCAFFRKSIWFLLTTMLLLV